MMLTVFLAAAQAAPVEFVLAPDSPPFHSIELRCGVWRERAPVVDGQARFPEVPDDDCKAYFKGGPPAFVGVRPGTRLECGFSRNWPAPCTIEELEAAVDAPVVVEHAVAPPAPPPPPPNLRLAVDAPPYTDVDLACGTYRAHARLVDGAAYVPDLPSTPCEATFSATPLTVTLPGGPATCGGPEDSGQCTPGADIYAPLEISLEGAAPPFRGIEVQCPSGLRTRATFVDGAALVPNVPKREACKVFFLGGPPIRTEASGGQSRRCSFAAGRAVCI